MAHALITRTAPAGRCPVPRQGRVALLVVLASLALHAGVAMALGLAYRNHLSSLTCPVTGFIRVTLLEDTPAAPPAPLNLPPPAPAAAASAKPLAQRPVQPATPPQNRTVHKAVPQPARQNLSVTSLQPALNLTSTSLQPPQTSLNLPHSPAPAAYPGAGVSLPAAVATMRHNPIVYPPLARARGYEGQVLLHLKIAPHGGRPQALELAASSGHAILDRSAINTVKTWHFSPPSDPAKPWHALPVTFRLAN